MPIEINDLVEVSKSVGNDIAFVQGGGGNTSIKLDDHRMAIKASGFFLKNMDLEDGYSIVDFKSICAYLQNSDSEENVFVGKIKSMVLETQNRPSIETSLHAVLGRAVIHTHSVYANVLNCSKEGKEIIKQIDSEAVWVDYAAPGRDLSLKVLEATKALDKEKPIKIFLQNHGVIVSDIDAKKTLALHTELNKKVIDFLALPSFKYNFSKDEIDLEFMASNVLFPDQIVYTQADQQTLETDAAKETLVSYNYILENIRAKGLTPNFLTNNNIDSIQSMESEKFRIGVLKNDHHSSPN